MENDSAKQKQPVRRWRRAVVATWVLIALVASGVIVLPTALMQTKFRDQPLNEQLAKSGLTATSQSASGGWLSPIILNDVEIRDQAGHVTLQIKQIKLQKSALTLLSDSRNLGLISIVEPDLILTLDDDGNLPLDLKPDDDGDDSEDDKNDRSDKVECQFEIVDAGFTLVAPWRELPIVQAGGFQISGDVQKTPEGHFLNINPVALMDHQILTDADTAQNLALIAPVVAQTTAVEGAMSVNLEGSSIQLDGDDGISPFPIRGTAVIHSLQARLRQEWAADIGRYVGRSVRPNIPSRLTIAQDSAVAFEVDQVGIHHHGLAFLLPELLGGAAIDSSGTVGLDEQLDLTFAVALPQMQSSNPLLTALSTMIRNPIQLKVSGTVDDPKLETPPGFSLIDQFSASASPTGTLEEPPPVGAAVMELIGTTARPGTVQQTAADLPGGVFNLIRSIRDARENDPEAALRAEQAKARRAAAKERRRQRKLKR